MDDRRASYKVPTMAFLGVKITLWDRSQSLTSNLGTWLSYVARVFFGLVLLYWLCVPIIMILVSLVVCWSSSILQDWYMGWCRPRLEPTELRAMISQADETTIRVNQAKIAFLRCKSDFSTDEALDSSLDSLMATANETVGILELAAESLDAHCQYAPLWTKFWYARYHKLQFTWLGTVVRLRRDYLDAESGNFLILDPSTWETISEYFDDEEARNVQVKLWNEKESSLFIRRWLRVHPSKSVRIITAGLIYTTGCLNESANLSWPFYTEEDLKQFIKKGVPYYPKYVRL